MRGLTIAALLLSTTTLFANGAKHHFTLLSDMHYDPNYGTPTAYGLCTTPDSPAMGQPGCDSPIAVIESTFADIAANAPSDSYLVFTGDWLRHGIALDESVATFRNLTRYVKGLPHTTIPAPSFGIGAIGNNDFIPDYFFNVTDTETSTVGMYGALLREADLISDAENATFAKAAYYARDLPGPNLRFLVLNTLPYSTQLEPPIDPKVIPDPVGQFAWMESELADAKSKNISVILTSHIPPTMNAHNCVMGQLKAFIQDGYLNTFRDIVNRYKDTIVYQFYGHTHQFSYLADPTFPVPGVIVPSITKIFGNTASYLLCEYDDVTKQFSNFRMRHLDDDQHTWSTFVSANGEQYLDKELGGMSSLEEMNTTALKLLTNEAVWDRYAIVHAGGVYKNMWPPLPADDGVVRLRHTCSIIAFSKADYQACLVAYSHITNAPSGGGGGDTNTNDTTISPGVIVIIVAAAFIGVGCLLFMVSYSKKYLGSADTDATGPTAVEPLVEGV